MNPYYYRAIKYSWNEDRYRTPGVDRAKAVPEIGADGVEAPQVFPAATPLKGKSESSEEARQAGRAQAPDNVYLPGSPAAAERAPHPFHIPTQWDSHNALRTLGAPKFMVGLDLWALESGVLGAAEALAKKYSAQLLFTHALGGTDAEAEDKEVLRRLREFQTPYVYHSFTGAPAEVLLREARLQQASLLILATHGRKGKERVLLGSVAEAVLKQAEIPVLIHRSGTRWPELTKILVPFEDLRGALPAIGPATKLSRGFGADLWMIHVRKDSEPDSVGMERTEGLFAELPEVRSEVREIAPRGDIPESIAAFAESEEIDLLVMPSQREDPSKKILPGGVAAQVMRKVHCSVLVVPK
ncbi:MAG: universal stress protein [Deltaproteobacteria bacterium]|nr:universal stress protein [Deltaproteobacteria bacterium]